MMPTEQTSRQRMLAEQRAKNENQRRLILSIFDKAKLVLSIDEVAFRTKLPRQAAAKRLRDCAWFASHRGWGAKLGHYELTAAGKKARRQGLHEQRVEPKPPRPLSAKRAYIFQHLRTEPAPSSWPGHVVDAFAEYIPTEEELQAAIAEVQATWDDEDRYSRRTVHAEPLGSLD